MAPKRRRRGTYENSAVSLNESRGISSEEVRMEEFDRSSTNISLGQQPSTSPHIFSTLAGMDSMQTAPDPQYASPSRDVAPPTAPRRTRSLPRRPKDKEEVTSTLPRDSASVPARPHRRSKVGEFFTVPRRKQRKQEVQQLPPSPPRRPARSGYATPGPPKAPQRRRASTPLPTSIPASEDLESGEERVKELTAGEIVSKMRGRPLPPPPRPPRRGRTQSADRSAWEEVVEGHLTLGSDRGPESLTSTKSLSDVGRVPPEEVSIAIQTDPLPYEYCMEDGALDDGVILMSSERASEGDGRRSPLSWPTPPPTPPPTARRQRRQAASRRATAASVSQESTQMEAAPVQETIPIESASEPPPPTPPKSPAIERRIPTPQDTVDATSTPLHTSTQERLAEDEPPSIPPLPAVIPPREIQPFTPPPETPAIPSQEPQTVEPTIATSALPPPVETEKVQTQEPSKPVTTEEPTLRPQEQVIEVTSKPVTETLPPTEVPVRKPSPVPPPVEDVAPVAPPRPPKPAPKPVEVPPPPVPSLEPETLEPGQQHSIPPPSFQQLRSPTTTTEEQQPPPPTQQMPFSPPPSYYFPPQPTSEDPQGRSMPFPSPPMGAVALLCVGEISARKLVVSEFQAPNWGPRESSEAPPPEPRRSSSTRGADFGGRRRMPSVPTRRRPPPRRSQSESGKEGVGKEDYTADPEDPELPGVGELSGRLARACGNAAVTTVRQLLLTAVERVEGDGRTEAAIIIALVMAVALVVLTMGHTRQGHRWDFYLPPAP